MYFTATFPYIVLIIFFGRGVSLEGAGAGIAHMFKPQVRVWILLIAFDVRRTPHKILGFLWYSVGIPVVLKGDLLWYLFYCTSAFSVPSWIIYLVGTNMLNTVNLTYDLSNGCVGQWIMCCPYTSKDSGLAPAWWDFFVFRSHFICFVS